MSEEIVAAIDRIADGKTDREVIRLSATKLLGEAEIERGVFGTNRDVTLRFASDTLRDTIRMSTAIYVYGRSIGTHEYIKPVRSIDYLLLWLNTLPVIKWVVPKARTVIRSIEAREEFPDWHPIGQFGRSIVSFYEKERPGDEA